MKCIAKKATCLFTCHQKALKNGAAVEAPSLPTSTGPVIDVGWTGIAHDDLPIGNAKVTVAATCTGTHPNCSCGYTGPIAN